MKYPYSESNAATYCPESNLLHLYVGRVPRPEYDSLRAEGWRPTPKQSQNGGGEFAATWTPSRRNTALEYAGFIGDEDQSPQDRAADRAERFGEYRDKRAGEAGALADRFDSGPAAHGYQSQARAARAAARHDRIAGHAVDAWSKAEYWTRRTAGVIDHALYKSRPDVRMGRIKTLEAEQRKHAATLEEAAKHYRFWQKIAAMEDPAKQTEMAIAYANAVHVWSNYMHPRPETVTNPRLKEHPTSLCTLLTMTECGYGSNNITGAEACALYFSNHREPNTEDDWSIHYTLRLAYENQMLEAQGGRAAFVEMVPGGWLGNRQIEKVNKSSVTGRVVSVVVRGPRVQGWAYQTTSPAGKDYSLYQIETERLGADVYRPPTPEELAAFMDARKAEKKSAPKKETIPLINPTDADAERLQAIWNSVRAKTSSSPEPRTVERMTQAQYSALAGGTYSPFETVEITGGGFIDQSGGINSRPDCPTVAKVRAHGGRVIILSDKPQKPLGDAVWHDPRPAIKAEILANWPLLEKACHHSWTRDKTPEEDAIFQKARIVRWAYCDSMTQFGLTESGRAAAPAAPAAPDFVLTA